MRKHPAIFFDKNDHQLLNIVNDILERGPQSLALRSLLLKYMHPHGIKEMAAARGLRIAYAVASLLGSLELGKASDRLTALRSLRDEVLLSATTYYKKNTARVLLQIMKELLRSRDDELRQLKLAHDFRMVSTGNPRKVRAELAKYHLLEMPEEWNQFAFDDHVHDANTKGRKSPTHLVMDAWIKGIRHLTVVYYNFVKPEVVEELVEASAILDLKVQVGIEMSARFRDKYVRFTWEPHGFTNNSALLKFLDEPPVKEIMAAGREVSRYQQQYVFSALEAFNTTHRHDLARQLSLPIEPCTREDFLAFVGTGQPSLLHLGRCIHLTLVKEIRRRLPTIQEELHAAATPAARQQELRELLASFSSQSVEGIIDRYLLPSRNPHIHDPSLPHDDETKVPALLRMQPEDLLNRLQSLHSNARFTLNLGTLTAQDTLELLYSARGMITHVEAYNLKSAAHAITSGILPGRSKTTGDEEKLQHRHRSSQLINDLQQAVNDNNVITLKRAIRAIIWDYEEQFIIEKRSPPTEQEGRSSLEKHRHALQKMEQRKRDLISILSHLEDFHHAYARRSLHSRIGTGSTGQAEHRHGMGLVVTDTLPAKARKSIRSGKAGSGRKFIPVTAQLTHHLHSRSRQPVSTSLIGKIVAKLPLPYRSRTYQWSDWSLDSYQVHPGRPGNILTLGGIGTLHEDRVLLDMPDLRERFGSPWKYLNTNLKNSLKVLIGFIPAFLTFSLTKDWWLLAYCGAFIWFGITGSRNIIQSVLGGGGLKRSPLLPWNSLISWSRIADSLLYTGFSVPLLDYLVKTLLLDRTLGITTATNPLMLYAVMGLANGIYISSHNIFRGLPRSAATGNFFRSILAIPVAVLLNSVLAMLLGGAGTIDTAAILQKWAAIISKFASDCVAAIIEGLADRAINIRQSLAAYKMKIAQLFSVFSHIDMLFPEDDVLELLQRPKHAIRTLSAEAKEHDKLVIVNALDLMYFWMYQPRARKALSRIAANMAEEEWLIFYRSQLVLKRNREISQMFVDGLVGKNFAKALSFYLDRSEEYLLDMQRLGERRQRTSGKTVIKGAGEESPSGYSSGLAPS